ncbi:hypothetical protein FRC10_005881 [Ceratobasidium sp. 414]|nr:hypothetical protein FRC10_005881 [Ceratobasidium sp. 414]
MEVWYPVKVLYTLGTSQLMLARADAIECRPVKPRPNAAKPDERHASTTLKDCLSALCTASPELLADPRTDHSVYALDPLQAPELMVGRGLLTWLMAESGRVVGTIREDYVDGEEMEVLEIKLSLTPTVAVSRAQHASSLQHISQPAAPTTSANPSPPSTPSGQSQTTRASTRLRIKSTTRAKEKAVVAAAAPQAPKKRGRQKGSGPPPQVPLAPGHVGTTTPSAQDAPIAGPSAVSPVPSRAHSRVSSVSSLALSQTQAQPQSQSRPPTSFGSVSTPASNQSSQPSRPSSQTPQPQSPNRSLARLLLAASASSSNASGLPNVGTPLFDSLVERLKTTGLLAQLGADQSTTTDAQRQALLSFIGRISGSSPDRKGESREGDGEGKSGAIDGVKTSVPSPAFMAIRSPPNPTPSPAPSPAVISAPSPAMLAAPSPSTFATPIPPPDSNRGTRKREPEGRLDSTEPKRACLGLGLSEARTSSLGNLDSHLAQGLKLEDGGYASASGLGVSPSPSPSVASPSFSATSPNFTAPSPNLSALGAPSPNLSVPSPNISAASPYSYPYPASTPSTIPLDSLGGHSGTWPSSQPTPSSQPLPSGSSQPNPASRLTSQPNLSSGDSKPALSSRKRTPRETPLHAQTDLPLVSGPFVTPRDQIGLPRAPPPPSPVKCVAGPGRAKWGGNRKEKREDEKEAPVEKDSGRGKGDVELEKPKEKDRTVRGVSEEEVRGMLADGHYPRGGLDPGHRRLFGAKNAAEEAGGGESDVGKAGSMPRAGPTTAPTPTTAPANNYYRTGSSKYYRTSNAADEAMGSTVQPAPRSQKSSGALRRAPPIPKHSPVALPPVSRLPMMMTSPIRATAGREPDPEAEKGRKGKAQKGKGAKPPEPAPAPAVEQPTRQFPLSLSEYSPLRRLLKNAGVDSLGDVLGQGGVLGLKGDGGWNRGSGSGTGRSRAGAKAVMIKEQEREVVDLTSDAEEGDVSVPVKAPALARKPSTPESRTPTHRPGAPPNVPTTPPRTQRIQPQFSTPRRTSTKPHTPPRQARTSPDRGESPLFARAVTGDAYTQDPGSEGLSIPLDLPPSSPPAMSDSDLEAGSGVDADGKDGYREAARYTDAESSEGGFGVGEGSAEGSDIERQFDPETEPEDEDEDGGGWNETIRPPEPDSAEIEPAAQDGAVLDGLGAGDAELDLDTLANFLDMLGGGVSTEMAGGPNAEQFSMGLEAVLGQTPAHADGTGLDPSLDFSWLDALGNSNPGEAGFETGAEGVVDLVGVDGGLAGHDLTEILAALGAG